MKYMNNSSLAKIALITSILALIFGGRSTRSEKTFSAEPPNPMIIDDFSSSLAHKTPAKEWEFITDGVMGGLSTGKMDFSKHDGRSSLHMTGSVSLENNGGFIQARLNLNRGQKYFNAAFFDGIQLNAKGNSEEYAIHFRTADTLLPWQYYQASFKTDGIWQTIKIPFKEFKPFSLNRPLDISKLKTIAVAAIKKKFQADIYIDNIVFYKDATMFRKLTPEEERIIIHKQTEAPFSGKYDKHYEKGIYNCKRCGAKLFESSSKFDSGCGWPSFDDEIENAVKRQPDPDGRRIEITCAACDAHLGHVFTGEGFTSKNTRHCVNSISLEFISSKPKTEKAIFASGCFWGTEYHFKKAASVISTTVGYTGGTTKNPTYKQLCTDKTGHAEAVEVVFDPNKTTYEKLARLYFETHDFTQLNRQGPDIGTQYRSEIFYLNDQQKKTAEKLITILKQKGYDIKTRLTPAKKFWPAEDYHQDYYQKTGKKPYCHIYKKIF